MTASPETELERTVPLSREEVIAADRLSDRTAGLASAAGEAAAVPSDAERLRGRLMHRSLQALLNRVPGARAALPHLAALETGLAHQGAMAVRSASPKGLAKVQHQLRALPLDPADGPAQDLLALVQRTLREQARTAAREPVLHQLSPHDPQSTVIITEGSESEFMEALADARAGQHAAARTA